MKKTVTFATVGAVALVGAAGQAVARDQVRIVGSSTVYPFATVVAERFGKGSKFKTPVIEADRFGGRPQAVLRQAGREDPGHHQRLAAHQEERVRALHQERHQGRRIQDRL